MLYVTTAAIRRNRQLLSLKVIKWHIETVFDKQLSSNTKMKT